MKTLINFSGIGFEVGQEKSGLALSSAEARKYFHYLKDLGLEFVDHGDALIPNVDKKIKIYSHLDMLNVDWKKYREVYLKTLGLLKNPYPLLNWGGDHSLSLATVSAFLSEHPEGYVVWIDAHADVNLPESSITGNLHGMPLALLLNLNNIASERLNWIASVLDPKKIIYVGLRDIDLFESETIERLGIKMFSYEDIQLLGMAAVAKEILALVNNHPIHISFDIDSVDPRFAPSTGVPVKYGLTPNDLDVLGEDLFKKSNVRSLDIVEINPELGSASQVDRTYRIAFNFLRSIFNYNVQGEQNDCISERESSARPNYFERYFQLSSKN